MFLQDERLATATWQSLERTVARLLLHSGYSGVRLVGRAGDKGADLVAHKLGKRWLFQVKRWKQKVGLAVVEETVQALRIYRADIPVIVAPAGFEESVREQQQQLMRHGVPLQLWDRVKLLDLAAKAPKEVPGRPTPRPYQEEAIQAVLRTYLQSSEQRAMVVMATGLGKSFTATEAVRRIQALREDRPVKVLAIVHTNELVYQLEKSFWPCLTSDKLTLVWNGLEHPGEVELAQADVTVACLNTVADHVARGGALPHYDLVLVDECHHVGGEMYGRILTESGAGGSGGPFLLGLTATPWRPDETDLEETFGPPLVTVDIVTGMRKGYLANVDYRMYTDNINWEALASLRGGKFTPRAINRTLFISEWDDGVIDELQRTWREQERPRAIVFCGTVDHAITMRDRINARGFCNAAAIYSQTAGGRTMDPAERSRVLADFHDGQVNVVCVVDIFNEGVDVPDVNIICFQRVTHSRRIFVQQLGRGLRLAPGKEKVIVLDFVSDIRRFAAGLDLKDRLAGDEAGPAPGSPVRIRMGHNVSFRKIGGEDRQTESFLRHWLEDVAAVEAAGEDASILQFPPPLPGGR